MKLKAPKSKHNAVMLIDDCEIENCINGTIIKKTGFAENIYKHSGAVSSLEFLKNLEMLTGSSHKLLPTYIFLDINMPALDGFQFLDEFNNLSTSLKEEVKIVMLSSSANPIDIKKASSYKQVVKFIQKPLTKEALNNLD